MKNKLKEIRDGNLRIVEPVNTIIESIQSQTVDLVLNEIEEFIPDILYGRYGSEAGEFADELTDKLNSLKQ